MTAPDLVIWAASAIASVFTVWAIVATVESICRTRPAAHPPAGPRVQIVRLDDSHLAFECLTCDDPGLVIHADGTGSVARALIDWNHACSQEHTHVLRPR